MTAIDFFPAPIYTTPRWTGPSMFDAAENREHYQAEAARLEALASEIDSLRDQLTTATRERDALMAGLLEESVPVSHVARWAGITSQAVGFATGRWERCKPKVRRRRR